MTGDHPDRDDLVAYSLDALDPRETAEIEAHAPGCARCTRELEALVPAVAVLGESVEQLEPPPELRERVLAIVREEAEAKQAELSGSGAGRKRRRGASGEAFAGCCCGPRWDWLGWRSSAPESAATWSPTKLGTEEANRPSRWWLRPGSAALSPSAMTSSMLDLHGLKHHLSGRQVYQVWVGQGSSVRPVLQLHPEQHRPRDDRGRRSSRARARR